LTAANKYTGADNYQGNNDGAGGDNSINPAFLSIRVKNSFTRLDGSTAIVEEPLVKRKFALSRLGLVTYSATASQTNSYPGDSIYDRFGLYRSDPSLPWTYDHGSSTSPTQPHIMTLSEVAAANREPDFAELLKAAICAGSLAKGGPNLNDNTGFNNYQYVIDTALDYNILQLMANLIDQYSSDGYPTAIQINAKSVYRTFRGIKDLPYLYRFHPFSVVSKLPVPLLSKSNTMTFTHGTTLTSTLGSGIVSGSTGYTLTYSEAQAGTLTNPGEADFMYIPEVWNPHAMDDLAGGAVAKRPTRFQLVVSTQDPAGVTPLWAAGAMNTPS
jgi:hypothetical protein